ncbi:MAG: protein translocase subunit SecD [Terriglobia bacterium]
MEKSIRNRSILVLIVVLVCIFGIVGFPSTFTKLKNNLADRIRLGLDLKGGTYLVLQVHVEDAVNNLADQAVARLRDDLRTRNIAFAQVQKTDATHVLIKGVAPNSLAAVESLAASQFPDWYIGSAAGDQNSRVLSLKTSVVATTKDDAFKLAMATINRRINGLGVTETTITQYGGQGSYEMVVELPGISDPSRVKSVIQSTAMLELKIVRGGPYPSKDEALASFGGVLPLDTELLPGVTESGTPAYYLVDSIAAITGSDLHDAEPSQDSNGRPDINFMLTRAGAARFSQITQRNIGKDLAIVLDNQVQSAPVIQGQISDNGQITGSFTPQQASDLALKLRSGALPASISYLQESTVGPSLGADSIHHGVEACIIGFLAILIFMLVYYKGAGINADVALILNLVILIAAMVYFNGVLTLPGIAGVILTVGMGVDSNVLIFERIREELRAGKAAPAAVAGGFDHAFKTIIDTHVTTVASAAILFAFGTGPVRGFAVTLTIGLVANLFTSVFVSRVIFDYVLSRRARGEALSV